MIYFANEFGDPQFFFLHLNISVSLSNKYADLKTNSVGPFSKQTKKTWFFFCKKFIYIIFFKSAYSLVKGEERL